MTKDERIAPSALQRPTNSTVDVPQTDDIAASVHWLLSRGWRVRTGSSAWRFSKPPFRGVYYTLKDALELERSKK